MPKFIPGQESSVNVQLSQGEPSSGPVELAPGKHCRLDMQNPQFSNKLHELQRDTAFLKTNETELEWFKQNYQ